MPLVSKRNQETNTPTNYIAVWIRINVGVEGLYRVVRRNHTPQTIIDLSVIDMIMIDFLFLDSELAISQNVR